MYDERKRNELDSYTRAAAWNEERQRVMGARAKAIREAREAGLDEPIYLGEPPINCPSWFRPPVVIDETPVELDWEETYVRGDFSGKTRVERRLVFKKPDAPAKAEFKPHFNELGQLTAAGRQHVKDNTPTETVEDVFRREELTRAGKAIDKASTTANAVLAKLERIIKEQT